MYVIWPHDHKTFDSNFGTYTPKSFNQDTMLHLLNKKARVSSDILIGHVTSSQNETGLSKYLMVRE